MWVQLSRLRDRLGPIVRSALQAKGFQRRRFGRLCIVALLCLIAAPSWGFAADSLRELSRRLLVDHWEPGEVSKQQLDELTERVAAEESRDSEVWYALGLAQLRQLRYRESISSFEKALVADPTDLHLMEAVIWGKILIRQPRQAAVRLADLATAIAASSKEDPGARRDDLDFLGTIVGYLGLPIGVSIDERELERQRRRIAETLNAEDLAVYETARDEAARLFESLDAEKVVERDIATDDAERERVRMLEVLKGERERLTERSSELQPQIERLQLRREEALSDLRQRDAPLASQWSQAAAQVRALDLRIIDIEFDIVRLNRLAAGERDPFLRGRWLWEAGRLQFVLNDLVSERRSAGAFADSIALQRQALQNEFAAVRNEYDSQLSVLETDLKQVRRQQTINESRTRRESGPLRVSSGRAESYSQKSRTLATYAEFPLESERLRLIDQLEMERSEKFEDDVPGTGRLIEESDDALILDGRDK